MIRVAKPKQLPFFAELPYYLWGSVNYNSEGNCKSPRDRNWTHLEINRRGNDVGDFSIRVKENELEIEGANAQQIAEFFTNPEPKGLRRAQLVAG